MRDRRPMPPIGAALLLALVAAVFLPGCDDSPVASPDSIPPAAISDLSVTDVTDSSVVLEWTAVGDDGSTGRASAYDIRYSATPIHTEGEFLAATSVSPGAAPDEAGVQQQLFVDGLDQKKLYYFAIRVADEQGNWSGVSNVVEAGLLPGDFSLLITVVDESGGPVAGLTAKLNVLIPEIDYFGSSAGASRRAATSIRFELSQDARAEIRILDLFGGLVRELFNRDIAAGTHSFIYDGTDESGQHIVGTTVLQCELRIWDLSTDELIQTESVYPVYYPSGNFDLQPTLGVSDAAGTIVVTDRTLFPGLLDLPELILTGAPGGVTGTFSISNEVVARLSDGAVASIHGFTVEPGRNEIELVWEESSPSPLAGVAGMGELPVARSRVVREGPAILHQNYPNPFN